MCHVIFSEYYFKDHIGNKCTLGAIQVLRNARGGGWVYAQALRSVTSGWGGVTSALRNVIFFS